jgi:hypothetical protein
MRTTEVTRYSAPGGRVPSRVPSREGWAPARRAGWAPDAGARQPTGGRQGALGLRVSTPEAEREGYFACSGHRWWWGGAWGALAPRIAKERRLER